MDTRSSVCAPTLCLLLGPGFQAATDPASPAPNTAQEEETQLLENLRNNIMQNFEDRTQIQRSLLDLEELQIQNAGEVSIWTSRA